MPKPSLGVAFVFCFSAFFLLQGTPPRLRSGRLEPRGSTLGNDAGTVTATLLTHVEDEKRVNL